MPIEFRCHQCKKKLRVADVHAGKRAKCPNCQTIVNVPQPEAAAEADDTFADETPASNSFDFPAVDQLAADSAEDGFDFSAGGTGADSPLEPQAAAPFAGGNPFAASPAGSATTGKTPDKRQAKTSLLSRLLRVFGIGRGSK